MSFKRFIEQVGENLAKNAKHAAEDVAGLAKIREGALHDVESIVRGLKPADIVRKEASIRNDMNILFLREKVPVEQRQRLMDAVLDTAKNPKPEAPLIRTTNAATDPRAQSSQIINPATGRPFEAVERRAAAVGDTPSAPPTRPAAPAADARAAAAPQSPPRQGNNLTGNQAADADILGGRAVREQQNVAIETYWSTRAGDLKKITLQFSNAKNDPLAAAKMLREMEEKYSNVINPAKKYTGPEPIDVDDVIAKIRADEKVMENGSIKDIVGISKKEFEALRKSIYDPLVEKMASELKTARWNNAYSVDDFSAFDRAIKETGRYGGATRPGGNLPSAKALDQLRTPDGKIYADELSTIKMVSPKAGLTDAQVAASGEAKFGHRVLDGALGVPKAIKGFFFNPAKWEGKASKSFAGRVGGGLLALGTVIGQPFVDIVPDGKEYKGINAIEYHFGMMRGWASDDYQNKIIKKFESGTADAMTADMARQFLAKKNEATEESNIAAVKGKEQTQKRIAEDRTTAIQAVGQKDAEEYAASRRGATAPPAAASGQERGVSVVDADAAVGQLFTQYQAIDLQQMTKLAAVIAQKSAGGSNQILTQQEYESVKQDNAYKGIPKTAQQKLDELLAPKLAP